MIRCLKVKVKEILLNIKSKKRHQLNLISNLNVQSPEKGENVLTAVSSDIILKTASGIVLFVDPKSIYVLIVINIYWIVINLYVKKDKKTDFLINIRRRILRLKERIKNSKYY